MNDNIKYLPNGDFHVIKNVDDLMYYYDCLEYSITWKIIIN